MTILWTRLQPGPFRRVMRADQMIFSLLRGYFFGNGPATNVPGGLHAFIKTRPELSVPDVEFMFRNTPDGAHLWLPPLRPAYADGFALRPVVLHPDSRGEVLLRSSDPLAPPRIRLKLFNVRNDLITLREGVKRAREVAGQPPLDPFRGKEVAPGVAVSSDDQIEAWIQPPPRRRSSRVDLRDGHSSDRRSRSPVSSARRGTAPRHRRFSNAGLADRAPQCLRHDDGREGRRSYPRTCAPLWRRREVARYILNEFGRWLGDRGADTSRPGGLLS